jgi:predicted dehydrogenase
MNKIKIAFLGGGINSAIGKTHFIAINMDNRYDLICGCFSRNEEINMKSAAIYGIPKNRIYNNLESLIENEKNSIDALSILTPTPNHKDEVIFALKNNINVICEKALTTSSANAQKIKYALKNSKGMLAITYNYTGYPMIRELKNLIERGMLGKITQINIEMPQETYLKTDIDGNVIKPQEWRQKDYEIPSVSLDLGSHIHNLISFLIEEKPKELIAVENSFGHFNNLKDNIIAIINYTNNIVSNIWYTKAAIGKRNGLKIQVYGKKGSASWYQLDPENLYFNDSKGNRCIIDRANSNVHISSQERYNRFKAGHPACFIEAFANYYSDIADMLNKKTNNYIFGIDNAIEGLKVLESISKSNKNKKWIKI